MLCNVHFTEVDTENLIMEGAFNVKYGFLKCDSELNNKVKTNEVREKFCDVSDSGC